MNASEGDPAVVSACELYAAPLYSYCLWHLADEEQAITALVDLFVGAQRLGARLSDPRLSRSLLYAMARSRCLRIRGEQDPVRPDGVAESFAWADGLDRAEQEALELSLRHGLDEQDVALVLGESRDTVRTRIADARAALDGGTPAPPLIPPPRELRPRILRGLAESYPALAEPVARALGENAAPTPQPSSEPEPEPEPEPVMRRRRRGTVIAAVAIVSLAAAAIVLAGAGSSKRPSSGHAASAADGHGKDVSSAPATPGIPPSSGPGLVAGPGAASPSSGGGASPTASPIAKTVPIGATSNPASSPPAGGPPSQTPTPPSSGPYLGVTSKQDAGTTTLTLTAIGAAAVDWSVTVSDGYLSVSQPSGTLMPGQSQVVTVTVVPGLAPKGTWHAKITVDPGGTVIPVNGGHGKPGGKAANHLGVA